MTLVRVHNLAISLDGFATGEPQSLEAPFGHAGERMHEWMFATRLWAEGVDNAFAERHSQNIGRRSWERTSSARPAGRTTRA